MSSVDLYQVESSQSRSFHSCDECVLDVMQVLFSHVFGSREAIQPGNIDGPVDYIVDTAETQSIPNLVFKEERKKAWDQGHHCLAICFRWQTRSKCPHDECDRRKN